MVLPLLEVIVAAALSTAAQGPPVGVSETFAGVQYVEGHPALGKKKTKGTLRLDATALSFNGADGRTLFSIPIEAVLEAEGRTVANEFPAPPDPRDYLAVTTSGTAGESVIVFRTQRWQAKSIAVKLDFFRSQRASPSP